MGREFHDCDLGWFGNNGGVKKGFGRYLAESVLAGVGESKCYLYHLVLVPVLDDGVLRCQLDVRVFVDSFCLIGELFEQKGI